MKRTIETYGKNGVIEITGNPLESILYLKDKPIQYSWFAEVGSTWRYHLAQGINNQSVVVNKEMQRILKRGIQNEGEFLAVTEYFNQFFKYGSYEYGLFELFTGIHWIDIPQNEEYDSFDYYGGSYELTPTQNKIDNTIVAEYAQSIFKGGRPTMILLHVENSRMFYILDGHHKFKAYNEANKPPYAVVITKLGNEYESFDFTAKLAKLMKCKKDKYLKRMKESKDNLQYYQNQKMQLDDCFRRVKQDEL